MKKKSTKSKVAPPTSYKAPSLPTLAALGVITATVAALTTGCKQQVAGLMIEPCDNVVPVETDCDTTLYFPGEIAEPISLPEE